MVDCGLLVLDWRVMRRLSWTTILAGAMVAGQALVSGATRTEVAEPGSLALASIPSARFEFGGVVGERVRANEQRWLLEAPRANPGMLGMFRMRDREPPPNLVPWAGEFAGKYLISAVQALRLSENPELRRQVARFAEELIATQAEDGYLGPFPRAERLLGHWDLWGHYHVIQGLLLWHEYGQDAAALAAARRAADLVCAIYLDSGRRVIEAGDPEMNMAMLHGLGWLYRRTGEPRYRRMMDEIERDWERAGDYVRAGLDGREFYQSPRPRWESLHDLQALLELWRITGEAQYRDAFEHHWRSIRRWDQRNTGGFSSGEQATGNPYAPTAIETCCTVAWMTLTADYLRLTGAAAVADDLELATLNAGLGAQHPSGRWWTYHTPMDGVREASAHTIVFQARAGTPELNCCSVNGPRVLGLLSEWAVMSAPDGWVVNWLGLMRVRFVTPAGSEVVLRSEGDYPISGAVGLRFEVAPPEPITLRVRIPGWATGARAALSGAALADVRPGQYLVIRRNWQTNDVVRIDLELPIRSVPGAQEAAGKVSLYRGPLLLAFDQAHNSMDEGALPPMERSMLDKGRMLPWSPGAVDSGGRFEAWVAMELPGGEAGPVRLVDFASAGATGTRYRTWFAAAEPLPPPVTTRRPADGASIAAGLATFDWRGSRRRGVLLTDYRLEIAAGADFLDTLVVRGGLTNTRVVVRLPADLRGGSGGWCYWRVISRNARGETIPDGPPARFRIDLELPEVTQVPPEYRPGPGGELVEAALRAGPLPERGQLIRVSGIVGTNDAVELSGSRSMLVYATPEFPEEEFSVSVRVWIREFPAGRIGQVFSAWATGMDDPLRLVVDQGKLYARVEAGQGFSTAGLSLEAGSWYQVLAVKRADRLALYVDGKPVGTTAVPAFVTTAARECALGGNPRYSGDESLAARFADFRLWARALEDAEIAAWLESSP